MTAGFCGGAHVARPRDSGEWEEKHMTTPPVPDTYDKLTHL